MAEEQNMSDRISDEEFHRMKDEAKEGMSGEMEGSNFGDFPEAPAAAPDPEDILAAEEDGVAPDEEADAIGEDIEDDEEEEDDEEDAEEAAEESGAPA